MIDANNTANTASQIDMPAPISTAPKNEAGILARLDALEARLGTLEAAIVRMAEASPIGTHARQIIHSLFSRAK